MTRARFAFLAACAAMAVVLGACNDVGSCPSASSITPGGACSGNSLECPYTLESPVQLCDGTDIEGGVATSCVCDDGKWSCPSPIVCESGAGDDSGGGAGDGGGD